MTDNKSIHFFLLFVIALFACTISVFAGEFVVGTDARLGQIVVLLSILLGMVLYHITDLLWKKYP